MSDIKVGDSVVSRTDRRGLRWRVVKVCGGFVFAERRKKGEVPLLAIYRTSIWRKRS